MQSALDRLLDESEDECCARDLSSDDEHVKRALDALSDDCKDELCDAVDNLSSDEQHVERALGNLLDDCIDDELGAVDNLSSDDEHVENGVVDIVCQCGDTSDVPSEDVLQVVRPDGAVHQIRLRVPSAVNDDQIYKALWMSKCLPQEFLHGRDFEACSAFLDPGRRSLLTTTGMADDLQLSRPHCQSLMDLSVAAALNGERYMWQNLEHQ